MDGEMMVARKVKEGLRNRGIASTRARRELERTFLSYGVMKGKKKECCPGK